MWEQGGESPPFAHVETRPTTDSLSHSTGFTRVSHRTPTFLYEHPPRAMVLARMAVEGTRGEHQGMHRPCVRVTSTRQVEPIRPRRRD